MSDRSRALSARAAALALPIGMAVALAAIPASSAARAHSSAAQAHSSLARAHSSAARAHSSAAQAHSSTAPAHASRVRSVRDDAHLHLASADGNTLVERGSAVGDLPGPVQVRLTLGERTASSSFTIHTSGGTISGRGQGRLKPGKGGYESFAGSVAVVAGTGRFRGAHGKGELYGSIYRVNDALSVQVIGTLFY